MTPVIAAVIIIAGIILYVSSLMVEIANKDLLISKLTTRAAELQRDIDHQSAAVDRIYQQSEDATARSDRAIANARATAAEQRAEIERLEKKINTPATRDCSSALDEIRRTFKK